LGLKTAARALPCLRFFPTTFLSHGVFIRESLRTNHIQKSSMKVHSIQRHPRRNTGFTLLEMVIVLGIIAMILGGAIFAMRNIGDSAKLTQADNDFKSLQSALAMYKLNAGTFPTSQQGLKALYEKPTSAPQPRRWTRILDKVPLDPWGQEYLYQFPGKKNPADFEIISKGKDGQQGTEDDLSSQDA
jgi:general secretion pathway protein G